MHHLGFSVNRDQFSGDVQRDRSGLVTSDFNDSPRVKAAAIELVENNLQPFRRVALNETRTMD